MGLRRFNYGGGMRGVPWWGVVSSAAAPVLMVGGWTAAAALQPHFDQVADTVSSLAAPGATDRWVMTLTFLVVGVCYILTGLALRPARAAGRLILVGGVGRGHDGGSEPGPGRGSPTRPGTLAGPRSAWRA